MRKDDVNIIIDYFLGASPEFLKTLGVDINKLPKKEEWYKIICDDLEQPAESKKLYYPIWQINDIPVGHSNINDIFLAGRHICIAHPALRKP